MKEAELGLCSDGVWSTKKKPFFAVAGASCRIGSLLELSGRFGATLFGTGSQLRRNSPCRCVGRV